MSDSPISVTVTGLDELNRFIKNTIKFARNPVQFYRRAGMIMLQDVMRHFQQEEGPDGKWAPLQYTRARMGKPKKGRRPRIKILQDTGRLKASIQGIATYKGAETGTNIIYARVHQYGFKERNLPARTFIWLSGTAEERIMGQLMESMQNI